MDSQVPSKLLPSRVQNGAKIEPKLVLEATWRGPRICSGGLSPLGGLLERSWKALGPKKNSQRGPWTALKKIPREVSALLGPKGLPKGGPKWAQNEVQKRSELKIAKP